MGTAGAGPTLPLLFGPGFTARPRADCPASPPAYRRVMSIVSRVLGGVVLQECGPPARMAAKMASSPSVRKPLMPCLSPYRAPSGYASSPSRIFHCYVVAHFFSEPKPND